MSDQLFRVLVIDDTLGIHEDFRKVLCRAAPAPALDDLEAQLFGGEMPAGNAPAMRYEIDSAYQGEAGVEMLRAAVEGKRPYAMAFVDMRMPPGINGVETVRRLWQADPSLQVAICTAYSDFSSSQIADALGIDGRLLMLRKPFDPGEIRQTAAALCDKWHTVRLAAEARRSAEAQAAGYRYAALHDALTGLPNRVLFADRLNRAIARRQRDDGQRFGVLFIDVDEFKSINDTHGHEAGDELLVQVAERVNCLVREFDTVSRVDHAPLSHPVTARISGDEFAVLLEHISADADAARVAQRLVDEGRRPYLIKGQPVRCTFSIGVTTSGLGYATAEDVLRDTDTAMYHAKRGGRNRFAMFDAAMHGRAVERLNFESDLRVAIACGGIETYYQPIVHLATGRVAGFEALARWTDPARGGVPPTQFIPVAEETGMILPLGLRVFETACRQAAAWRQSVPAAADLTISINLSRKQLVSRDIVRETARVLAETSLPPNALRLEITESCLMADTHGAINVLQDLHALGVQLQIDDFGTGYSSLSCLRMFPIGGLKIDRAFVTGITEHKDQAALLNAIIALAHGMNMTAVSEGVETPEQAAMVRGMGCDYAQGYLFAKPMPAAAATAFLQATAVSIAA